MNIKQAAQKLETSVHHVCWLYDNGYLDGYVVNPGYFRQITEKSVDTLQKPYPSPMEIK